MKPKSAFLALVAVNVVALFAGAQRFFVTFAQLPIAGPCNPKALGAVQAAGVESMRTYLFPSLMWLAGISLVNLVFAGIVVLRRRTAGA